MKVLKTFKVTDGQKRHARNKKKKKFTGGIRSQHFIPLKKKEGKVREITKEGK